MVESVETAKDVEKQLAKAKSKLQAFEDGVDSKRLLKRLRRSSPAHPVLMLRAMFVLGIVTSLGGAVGVMLLSILNAEAARVIARFDAIVPVPDGVPGLPALLGVIGACMCVAWVTTTLAALSMGREAELLPWEQTQHQKLLNDVTRLTTQRAVMERMRSTPAGARPRINTPVPVNMRERAGIATPSGLGRLSSSGTGGSPSRFGAPPVSQAAGASQNPFGHAPSKSQAPLSGPGFESPMSMGRASMEPTPAPVQDSPAGGVPSSNPFAMKGNVTPPGAQPSGPAPGGAGGVLARARSGSLKTTPAGAAGRINLLGGEAPPEVPTEPPDSEPVTANPFASQSGGSSSPFGGASLGASGSAGSLDEPSGDLPNIVETSSSYSASPFAERTPGGLPAGSFGGADSADIPRWGPIEDPWLEEALEKAESLVSDLPEQARMDFSQEVHLPFTLVINRASPAVAVRAMVSYVEFLSTIPTPQRARIELATNSSLDQSFHRNVEAALEPYYGDTFTVDLEPGRVEVAFHEPDAQWLAHEVLPME